MLGEDRDMSQDNASEGTKIPVNATVESPETPEATASDEQSTGNPVVEGELMTDEEIAAQDAEAQETAESEDTEAADAEETTTEENDAVSEETAQDDGPAAEEQPKEPDWKDAYIRLRADFDNYRKRTSKEFDDVRRRERERVIGAWLDVYDNAERALASMAEKSGPWFDGFSSLIQQMNKCLASFNIKPVEDVGEKFDPKRHEAIATMQDPSKENNTIAFVERKGFMYENGDIARVARVIVVKNPS